MSHVLHISFPQFLNSLKEQEKQIRFYIISVTIRCHAEPASGVIIAQIKRFSPDALFALEGFFFFGVARLRYLA